MLMCCTIDLSRVVGKKNPLFTLYKIYDIKEDSKLYNLYIEPFHYLKLDNTNGTISNINVNESSKVKMGLWFTNGKVIYEV